jgi:dolichol-phosphate mannosyltransferase
MKPAESTVRRAARLPKVGQGVSLVIPVLNEIDTLPRFLSALDDEILGQPWNLINEVVVVDDGSTDGTREILQEYRATHQALRVSLIFRDKALGSANAEITGCMFASNPWALKMDVDGQHSFDSIPRFVELMDSNYEVIVASRYLPGCKNAWSPVRGVVSRSAKFLSKIFIPSARRITDPVSGYFMIRTELTRELNPLLARYKMLLYVLARYPGIRVAEIPFIMLDRTGGSSKIASHQSHFVPRFIKELINYSRVSKASRRSSRASAAMPVDPMESEIVFSRRDTGRASHFSARHEKYNLQPPH